MKISLVCIIYFFLGFTLSLIVCEIFRACYKLEFLNKNKIDLPKDSATYKLASKDKHGYIKSQKKASIKKIKWLFKDLLESFVYLGIVSCFIISQIQHKLLSFCEQRLNILNDSYCNFRKSEVNFVNLIFTTFILISLWISDLYGTKIEFVKYVFAIIFSYFFIFPFIIILILLTLRKIGIQLIIACYLAYFIKLVPDIFTVDRVEDGMKKITSSKFPQRIQNVLKYYHLNNDVYIEKEPSANMNAALIGYGDKMRIEIYGDMDKLNKKKIYSVFLHELGHAYEYSLFKKATIYLSLLCIECGILVFFHKKMAKKYANEKMNNEVSFLFLLLIYKISLRPWVMILYKFMSHRSEIVSDIFTKNFDYNEELGKTLYEIGIDSYDYLTPTVLYNLLKSGHPSIYDRVEYLLKM